MNVTWSDGLYRRFRRERDKSNRILRDVAVTEAVDITQHHNEMSMSVTAPLLCVPYVHHRYTLLSHRMVGPRAPTKIEICCAHKSMTSDF